MFLSKDKIFQQCQNCRTARDNLKKLNYVIHFYGKRVSDRASLLDSDRTTGDTGGAMQEEPVLKNH